ncbi:heme ABC transporter ATP-binding protein [Chenggangzhangella methanolivorans]|uniref:Heme ABC transporter ATP-binding protein n=1 Tax=Chenggangzhangella methanolivorans TaxID=1437009 RepID=A0A9E6R6F5_9HYPH|nr:heme ABC transporter ATP-binding protein [Chenggangzhangella methanolivorans]QZN98674.1 heme ABC transporter ATP-binding protein [Chenggangzhangella methanolivorans]
MSGLVAEDVTVRLGGREVVSGASLEVRPGRVVVLIGPNGAGKSSLLGALSGELAPASGRVSLDGEALSAFRPAELARRRAVLAQATELAFAFTVDEVARLGLPAGLSRAEADAVVSQALLAVDMAGKSRRICSELSGGERQRVHLARVLAQLASAPDGRPRHLMLDEPTAGLDLSHQLATLSLARRHAEAGGGVLAVLHDVNLAAMAADEIVALKAGRIIARGAPAEVLTDAVMREVYDVEARIGVAPPGPFLLPQSVRLV